MVNFGESPHDDNDVQDLWYALSQIGFIDPETDRVGGSNEDVDALITTSFERNSMYNGDLYHGGNLVRDVRDDESTFLYIENPSNSTVLLDIGEIDIRSTGKAIITFIQNPTVDVQGASADIRNKRTGSSDTGEIIVESGGEYSGGINEEEMLLPSGEGSQRIGGQTSDRFALIDVGDSILIEVFNDSGRTTDQEINISYNEVEF